MARARGGESRGVPSIVRDLSARAPRDRPQALKARNRHGATFRGTGWLAQPVQGGCVYYIRIVFARVVDRAPRTLRSNNGE
eukprot:scaffold1650_cov351-Prasinococcus_capsulatus_cf.AAC.7